MNDKKDSFLDVGQIRVTKPFDPSIAWVKIPPDLIKAEGPTKESASDIMKYEKTIFIDLGFGFVVKH